jgi:putative two-component system response regulator
MSGDDRKTILVVDDVSMNLRTTKLALENHFNILVAKSGEAAIAALLGEPVDLILLDIEMPGMSGFETMDRIKEMEKIKDVPVIFVTSHASSDLIAQAKKRGARDYVMKPFSPEVLLRKIFAVLHNVDTKNVVSTRDGKYFVVPPKGDS